MIKVKIIRHAERYDYVNPLSWMFYFGHYWSDPPLSNRGYQWTKQKASSWENEQFCPKQIYTSPYVRTMATAVVFKDHFMDCQMAVIPLLAEYQPSYAHKTTFYPKGIPTDCDNCPTHFVYPESNISFKKRVKFIIHHLFSISKSDILIVTHGEVLRSLKEILMAEAPHLIANNEPIPYLHTLAFDYDTVNQGIVKESIKVQS